MYEIGEHDLRRRAREEMLAAMNATDDETAVRHRQRAEEYAGKARMLRADGEKDGKPSRPVLTLRGRRTSSRP